MAIGLFLVPPLGGPFRVIQLVLLDLQLRGRNVLEGQRVEFLPLLLPLEYLEIPVAPMPLGSQYVEGVPRLCDGTPRGVIISDLL